MEISSAYFGPFRQYVENPEITDIDYNGREIWLTTIHGAHLRAEGTDEPLTSAFIEQFCTRIANLVSKQFNKRNPVLEAETPELRVTILHEAAARNGRSISIRKTPPLIRMTEESVLATGFCSRPILELLKACVAAHMNFAVCGIPGAGKTECVKFLAHYIPEQERVITIEDTLEIRYRKTNPGKDCIEIRVDPEIFPYGEAIKTCLRMNPKWIMLSEARSREVRFLLESWSTGVCGMTTLHTDDVRNVPDRILNMLGEDGNYPGRENDIYRSLDVGLLIRSRRNQSGEYFRYIDQLCFYLRENGENKTVMVLDDGEEAAEEWPRELRQRLEKTGFHFPEMDKGGIQNADG